MAQPCPGNAPGLSDGTLADRPSPNAAPASRGRVLIVEDEFLVALTAEQFLSDAGFDVVGHAATAEAAIHLAALHRPDVVVMDIRLAGPRDGIDAAAEIMATLGIHSLFASAHSDTVTRHRAAVTKADIGWLSKPYSEAQLAAAVQVAVAEARNRR